MLARLSYSIDLCEWLADSAMKESWESDINLVDA